MSTVIEPQKMAALELALAAICDSVGIPCDKPRLIRYTMNAVWALDSHSLVVRMNNAPDAPLATTQLVAVARALAEDRAPVVKPASFPQPVHAGGWSATFWPLLPQPADVSLDPAQLAQPLLELHATTVPEGMVPSWNVAHKVQEWLNTAQANADHDLEAMDLWSRNACDRTFTDLIATLGQRRAAVQTALVDADWELPTGVIHGDAHTGNLLSDASGRALWCDLDTVAIGPREWDLVPAAFGVVRFGRDPSRYELFSELYGYDLLKAPSWPILREIRDLASVAAVLPDILGRSGMAAEVARRLRTILYEDRKTWERYS